ncbi:hypothetical protein IWQ60_001383 [Tieghemiomyces parasiticus]|uniref:Uncharacterized protein n=1 Tax=Tieghemiomyces parasiticus TaxID=78921 RepID=A0A9W8AES3_9FUNG|nr:hypothetical protein IWQ60_001383 [Tieghemiomyces parasiticus]
MNYYAFYLATYVLTSISMLCSVLAMCVVLWTWRRRPTSKSSPSFCLTLWIGLADLFLQVINILTNPITFRAGLITANGYARFINAFNNFSTMWFIALNAMIALDLHLMIFHGLARQAWIRRWYTTTATVFALFFAAWYLVLPDVRFLLDGTVTAGVPGSPTQYFILLWMGIWFPLVIGYVVAVVATVVFTIVRSRIHLGRFSLNREFRDQTQPLTKKAQFIIGYPIVLLVIYIPYTVLLLLQSLASASVVKLLTGYCNILLASQGILSLGVLLFHPVMLATYRERSRTEPMTMWKSLMTRAIVTRASPDSHWNLPAPAKACLRASTFYQYQADCDLEALLGKRDADRVHICELGTFCSLSSSTESSATTVVDDSACL